MSQKKPVSSDIITGLEFSDILREVNFLTVRANLELLKSSNVPKALEAWEVVNSRRRATRS